MSDSDLQIYPNSNSNSNQEGDFVWNFNGVPVNINVRGVDLGQVIEQRVRSHSQGSASATAGDTASVSMAQQSIGVEGVDHVPLGSQQGHGHSHGVRGGGGAHRHSHHEHGHTHHHPHGHPHNPSSPDNQQNSSFVIDLGGNDGDGNGVHMNGNGGGGSHGNNGGGLPGNGDQMQGIPTLRTVWKNMEGSVPFCLLMFAKTMYNHRLGILVFGALFGTFYHANASLRKQIAQRKETRSWTEVCGQLAWIITFLSANIFFMYFFFEQQELYKSLYMCLPAVDQVDVWNLMWIVGVTDFIMKFATIIVKALVAMLPKLILPYKKKGKYYMLIEMLSQFYRSLIPITPWVNFLLDDEHGGQWFSIILLILYAIGKGFHMWLKLKEVRKAFQKFKLDVGYGIVPDNDQMQSAENSCPICQDKFSDPVLLSCKHIFCEDCVSLWFDRERTCPMCRANIVDNPIWRDGSTSGSVQLY